MMNPNLPGEQVTFTSSPDGQVTSVVIDLLVSSLQRVEFFFREYSCNRLNFCFEIGFEDQYWSTLSVSGEYSQQQIIVQSSWTMEMLDCLDWKDIELPKSLSLTKFASS